jgi:glycerate kinase
LVLILAATIANIQASRTQMGAWRAAADLRAATVKALVATAQKNSCQIFHVDSLPDSIRGAYVFRNGGGEAFAAEGLQLVPASEANPACRFAWADVERNLGR